MRPLLHPIVAALGLASSFGALADKGSSGGVPNGLGYGRGGSRFADATGSGPANAFEQRAQLVKSGGLEFRASGDASPKTMPQHEQGPRTSARSSGPSGAASSDAAALAQGAAAGPGGKPDAADPEIVLAFAPWKVTGKDGKPAEKKHGPECGAK